MTHRIVLALGILLGAFAAPAHLRSEDPVLFWNNQILDAVRLSRTPPPQASVHYATLHAALYDTVNGISRTHQPYHVAEPAPDGASLEAAVAAAAHTILLANLGRTANPRLFHQAYEQALAAIPDDEAKTIGLEWGRHVARQILDLRRDSGIDRRVEAPVGTRPGEWRPTPPLFRSGTDPHWGMLKPFFMKSGDQFRPPPPPPLDSREYYEAWDEVRRLGHRDSTERPAYHTDTAVFWSDDLGTATPPGHWNVIFQQISRRQGLSTADNARALALLNMAMADAGISCWEAKYHYNFWRPEHAIREADSDGNPWTKPDPDWIPLMMSPTFPDYTSGHSSFSRTGAEILTHLLGDDVGFTTTSEGLPGSTRSYQNFDEAALEVGRSRIYGGIHYNFADLEAQNSMRQLARYVLDNFLLPVE
ncbi:MAG: phosphatase PAP2 family protein [Puniceicoccaceae bacterium]|nr:MAG: phosphatase PAP2 family protein [Puniceicoccaceae bacterium]